MGNILVRWFGYYATIFFGDPGVVSRFWWLRRHLKPGSLRTLDAGSGSGAFALYAARIGNETLGISFQERNNEVARARAEILKLTNIRFIAGDLRKLDEMQSDIGQFDQIICCETIEHIMGDQKLVSDFAKLLKIGGRVFITTPFKHAAFWKDSVVSEVENGDHVRVGYDEDDFARVFSNAGLELAEVAYLTGFIAQRLIALGQFLSRIIHPHVVWVVTFPLRILQIFDPLLTAIFRPTALSIAAVGVKRSP